MRFLSRRRFLLSALVTTGTASAVGCGTVLHPERRGQPAGPLDWKIVALDAIGLLLFFIPGVIAFAVDFTTGTIYLPPDQYGQKRDKRSGQKLVSIKMPEEKMTVGKLEQIVSGHAQRQIQLTPGSYQTEELKTIDEFWTATDKLTDA